MDPKICVLALNWNGRKHLEYFVPSALELDYNNFEVIVIDNGSTDDSLEFLNNNFSEVLTLPLKSNMGYSKGFNKGIEYALDRGAEYLLITNNDVKLDKNFLKAGISLFISQNNIGYMSGKVFQMAYKNRFQYAGGRIGNSSSNFQSRGINEIDVGQYEEIEDFEFMDDVCSLVSSKMIKEIGPYDEDFFFDYEETEWNIRIRNKGYRIVYNPKMKAWHRVHGSTKGNRYSPMPEFYHWRGKILFNYKTLSNSNFLIGMIIIIFLKLPMRFINLIVKQHPTLFLHTIFGMLSGFKRIFLLKQ